MNLIFLYWNLILVMVFDCGNSLQMHLQTTPSTFDQAILGCQALGMELAILKSKAECDEAVSYIKATDPGVNDIWIAYKIKDPSNKIFEWMDGETTTFCQWGKIDPNYFKTDSCVRISKTYSYMFADNPCSKLYGFLCTGIKKLITTYGATDTTVMAADSISWEPSYTPTEPNNTANDAVETVTELATSTEVVYTITKAMNTTHTPIVYGTLSYYNATIFGGGCCTCTCNFSESALKVYKNYTFTELKRILFPVTEQLRRDVLIDKTTLSAYRNKHISKKDDRPSARRLGYGGVAILILVFVMIIIADLSTWYTKYFTSMQIGSTKKLI